MTLLGQGKETLLAAGVIWQPFIGLLVKKGIE